MPYTSLSGLGPGNLTKVSAGTSPLRIWTLFCQKIEVLKIKVYIVPTRRQCHAAVKEEYAELCSNTKNSLAPAGRITMNLLSVIVITVYTFYLGSATYVQKVEKGQK